MPAPTILLVGCGNMGGAMLAGWLASGMAPAQVTVISPSRRPLPPGVAVYGAIPVGMAAPDAVVLAVKPQMLRRVAPDLALLVGADTLLLSVLAAVEIATLRGCFPAVRRVVRAVPNLPAAIGLGVMALAGEGLDAAATALAERLCAPLGAIEWLDREALCDAATSVSGCGPAFLFRFADAVVAAGAAQGLSADQALRLIAQTMIGAGTMLRDGTDTAAEMARRVASPGGVTLAGLAVLDRDDALRRLVGETLDAAGKRSAAMAAEARG